MDYSLDTPFHSYNEIQEAIVNNKAKLSFNRATAYTIACNVNKIYALSIYIIPILSIVTMLVVCQIYSTTKWVLLFGVVVFGIKTLVPHLRGLLWASGIILICLPLLFIHNAMYLLAIGAGILSMIVAYDIWWGLISAAASNVLLTDEATFESVWMARKVAIKTENGADSFHIYSGT